MRHLCLTLLLALAAACTAGAPSAPPPQSASAGTSQSAPSPGAAPTAGAATSPPAASANPYQAPPGQAPINVKAATCAVSGGFVHLYTAVDAGLFQQYGLNVEHVSISGSGPSLAAMSAGEIQFLYCAAEATIPGLASGSDARIVGSPLLGLPYVLLASADVQSVPDLRGKTIAVSRPGQLNDRLARMTVEKFGLKPNEDVEIRPIGGGQPEGFQALVAGVAQATPVTPPLDAEGRKYELHVIYDMNNLGLPFVYSAVHAPNNLIRDNPQLVQKFVAAIADAVYYTEKNPDAARAALRKVLDLQDEDALNSAYDAYAKKFVNRRLTTPLDAVQGTIDYAREQGTQVVKNADDIVTNQFADDLDRSGFLQQLWGAELPPK